MGVIKLEPQCPKIVDGFSVDPNPDWSFDAILSELNSLESKLNVSPLNPSPFIKAASREIPGVARREKEKEKAFVMRVSEYEMDDEDEIVAGTLVPARRYICNDIYLSESDDSEDESMQQLQVPFMDKIGVVEGAFLALTNEYQLGIKEDIRNQLAVLETKLVAQKEKSTTTLVQVERNSETRREMDRKLDMHYQRKIAEGLDNHLTAIQRDHEHRSQIEERKIRDDAAFEEAKRKEKALQEEKLRQQKAQAEEEGRREAARRAEEERKAAQKAERIAKEAADKMAKENLVKGASNAQMGAMGQARDKSASSVVRKEVQSTGTLVRAAEAALKLEERRLQKYKELEEKNQSIISSSDKGYIAKEREITRRIKNIGGSIESVRSKANEFVKIFNDPVFPQSVTVAMFAKQVVSFCETPNASFNGSAFACAHVIFNISTQVPAVMDFVLAELQKTCIYTVPKHIIYSKSAFETKDAYFKAIGYREEDGKLETMDRYLERLRCYMKLYGALVQTETQGVHNRHGLEEGWIWLARFLNALPANLYTAVALEAFLGMAGFSLHRKYKSQFRKILKAISEQFVQALKARDDPKANSVITGLQHYIESNKFVEEPQGWRLQGSLLSRTFVPEENHREQHHYAPYQRFSYHR